MHDLVPYPPPRVLAAAFAVVLASAAGAPAASAQEREVVREVYHNFFDSNLTVEVETEAAGRLRLIRGSRGRVEVAGRAPDGIASFGLDNTGRRRLSLTSLGSRRVDFIVVVPEQVRVHVLLPGLLRSELFGSMRSSATYDWPDEHARGPISTTPGHAPPAPPRSGPALTTLYAGATPPALDIADATALSSVTIRVEGSQFRLESDRLVPVGFGQDGISLDPAPQAGRIVVVVPADAASFQLVLDGAPALLVRDGLAQPLCDPVMEQELDGGRVWYTFSPATGLSCVPPSAAPLQRQT